MNIKFNDEERTILDVSETPILILNNEKIEFSLDKGLSIFNIDFVNRELAKKDFEKLKDLLEGTGYITIDNTLVDKGRLVGVSANERRCSIVIILDNGVIHEIRFENGQKTRNEYEKILTNINNYGLLIEL